MGKVTTELFKPENMLKALNEIDSEIEILSERRKFIENWLGNSAKSQQTIPMPFMKQSSKKSSDSHTHVVAAEILKKYPDGLTVSDLLAHLSKEKKLESKNPLSTVYTSLSRHKELFFKGSDGRWMIKN